MVTIPLSFFIVRGKIVLLVMDLFQQEVHLNPVFTMTVRKGITLDEVHDTLDATSEDLSSFKIFVLCVRQADIHLTMSKFIGKYNAIVAEIHKQNCQAFILYASVIPLFKNAETQRIAHAKNSSLRAEYMLKQAFSYFSLDTKFSNKVKIMPELISGLQLSSIGMTVFVHVRDKLASLHATFRDLKLY